MDTIVSHLLPIVGRIKRPYLQDWEASLGPEQQPRFPPRQIPCTPRYRYSRLDFNTRVRAAVVLHFVERAVIDALLPPLLQLDPAPGAPPGMHPVMFSFGLNIGFGAVLTPWQLHTITYLEFLASIPNTRLKRCNHGYCGPFLYPPRLWASNLLPVLVGKAFAFPKKFAYIDSGPDSFTIRPFPGSRTVASLKVFPVGNALPAMELQEARPWCSRVNQPIMTETKSLEPLFSHFQFEWDLAVAQPAELTLTINDAAFPILPLGVHHFPKLHADSGGGLLITSPCHLQVPFPRDFLLPKNPGPCDESDLSKGSLADRQPNTERTPNKLW
jgi:hypothetical protein